MKWIVAAMFSIVVCAPVLADAQMSESDASDIESLNKSISASSAAADYACRARIYAKYDMHEQSIQDYNAALKLVPNDSGLLWRRGMELACQGKYKEALTDCAQVVKQFDEDERRNLDYMQALRIRTRCYEKLGKMQEMVATFKELRDLGDKAGAAALKRWETDHPARN